MLIYKYLFNILLTNNKTLAIFSYVSSFVPISSNFLEISIDFFKGYNASK